MIYEESACFDPTSLQEELVHSENGFSKNHQQSFSMEELQSYHPQNPISQQLDIDLQNQLNLEMEHCYNNNNNNEMQSHLIQEIAQNHYHHHEPNWQEMNSFNIHGHFTPGPLPETPSDLLNIFPLPSSMLPSSSSINFSTSAQKTSSSFLASLGLLGDLNSPATDCPSGSVVFDPLLPLNLPPQPPMLRELFHGVGNYGINHGSLFGSGVDERDNHNINGSGLYGQDTVGRNFDNGVFVCNAGEMDCLGKTREGKGMKHFTTERHRRVLLNDKFQALRNLIPNPTKNDRASTVGDAIDYINELKRTVNELKVLMEKKRCAKERLKRPKQENEATMEGNGAIGPGNMDNPYNGSSLRSSWLHRKSKNTEVDVRIVDDEVNVKLVQQKKINCLLFVSRVLDELQLDLHHVAGGLIGDYYSFLFNSKICEGSIVYASAIADKLIEVVDKQYAAILPTSSY